MLCTGGHDVPRPRFSGYWKCKYFKPLNDLKLVDLFPDGYRVTCRSQILSRLFQEENEGKSILLWRNRTHNSGMAFLHLNWVRVLTVGYASYVPKFPKNNIRISSDHASDRSLSARYALHPLRRRLGLKQKQQRQCRLEV